MIKSFRCFETERLHSRQRSRKFQAIERVALRKLRMIDAARNLRDLGAVPGNHLKPLHDDREGQHSIRINAQWRVCFVWNDGDAYQVEITDYH